MPFAGKFEEGPVLVNFLRREVLSRRPDIRFIRIFAAWLEQWDWESRGFGGARISWPLTLSLNMKGLSPVWSRLSVTSSTEYLGGPWTWIDDNESDFDFAKVTDVQDFFSGGQAKPSSDPNIFISYAVQDRTSRCLRWVPHQTLSNSQALKRCRRCSEAFGHLLSVWLETSCKPWCRTGDLLCPVHTSHWDSRL